MSLVSEGAELAGNRASSVDQGPSIASVSDYVALMKPRVMALVVFTALVGVMIAPGHLHPVIGFTALLCIAVGAGAAGVLNMWYDADIDAVMRRTSARPIPQGRIAPGEALAFGIVLAAFAVGVLGLLVSWLAAALLAFTIFFYVAVYTAWLKRWTPQNIVIGGAAGAFPPVIGWVAATGSISLEPCLLFLIIFGLEETRRQILLYSIGLVPIGAAPWLFGYAHTIYGVTALLAGALMVTFAWRVRCEREGERAERAAYDLFAFSILYLFVLFAVLLVEGSVIGR